MKLNEIVAAVKYSCLFWNEFTYLRSLGCHGFLSVDSLDSLCLPAQPSNIDRCKYIAFQSAPSIHALQQQQQQEFINKNWIFIQIAMIFTFAHCVNNIEDIHVITDFNLLEDAIERNECARSSNTSRAMHDDRPLIGLDAISELANEAH